MKTTTQFSGIRWFLLLSAAVLTGCATQPPFTATSPVGVQRREAPPSQQAAQPPAPAVPAPAPTAPPVATPPPVFPPPTQVLVQPDDRPAPDDKGALLQNWVSQQERLYHVAAPLLINNTELCKRHARNLLGFTAKTKYSYSDEFVNTAEAILGLGDELRVMNVLPGSGAALSGIREGDILLVVEIEPLPKGPGAEKTASSLIGSEMQGRSSLSLTILRDGERKVFDVPLTPACAMAIDLGNTDKISAFADGSRIMVTQGMLGFVQSDEELAYVIAKEMGHNIQATSVRQDMRQVIDSLHSLKPDAGADALAASVPPYSPEADAAADALALYLLARAGYEISGVPEFWRRMERTVPQYDSGSYTSLHPHTDYRLSVIQNVMQDVRMKQQSNLPLVP